MVYQQHFQLHQEQHFEFNISSFFQIPYPGKIKNHCTCWEIATFSQRPSDSILTATRGLETWVRIQNLKLWTGFMVHSSSERPFISSLLFKITEGEEEKSKAAWSHTSSHLLYSHCVQLPPLARC